jgi:hypothetical protein
MSTVFELDTSRCDVQVQVHIVWHEPPDSRCRFKAMTVREDPGFSTDCLTRRLSEPVRHKVLGRGRPSHGALSGRWRACVLMRQRAAAELGW